MEFWISADLSPKKEGYKVVDFVKLVSPPFFEEVLLFKKRQIQLISKSDIQNY